MKNLQRMDREKAKELLAQIDSVNGRVTPEKVRQNVVQLLRNEVQTYSWVGIYLLHGNELYLDAWSGPQATTHTRIPVGKGICGFAAKSGKTEIVSDVSKDPRYLECFPGTKSELVVPIHYGGKVVGEIDIDSDLLNAYSSVDIEFLEALATKIAPYCRGAAV